MSADTFKLKLGKPTIDKDPDDKMEYTAYFTSWLARCSDTIASKTVTYTGVTEYQAPTHNSTSVTFWIQGGTPGTTASVRVRITTTGTGAQPRQKDQTLYFKIKDR